MQVIEHFIDSLSAGGSDKVLTRIKAKYKLSQLKQKDRNSEEYEIAAKKTMLEYITKFPNKGVLDDILIGYSKASNYNTICDIESDYIIENIGMFIGQEGLYEMVNILRLMPNLHNIIAPLLYQWSISENCEEDECKYIKEQAKDFTYNMTYEEKFGVNPFDLNIDIEEARKGMMELLQQEISNVSTSVKLKIVKEIMDNICDDMDSNEDLETSKIEIKELKNQNKALMSAIKIADDEMCKVKDDVSKIEAKLVKKDNNIEKLKQKIVVLNKEKSENLKYTNAIKKSNDDLERKCSFLSGDLENLKSKNLNLTKEKEKVQKVNKELLSSINEYKKSHDDFTKSQASIDLVNEENSRLKIELEYVNEKLDISEDEKNLITKKIENYKEEIVLLKKQLNLLNKKNTRVPNSIIKVNEALELEKEVKKSQILQESNREDIPKDDIFDIIKNEPKYK